MQINQSWKYALLILAIFFVSINLRPAITSIGPLLTTIGGSLQVSSTQMSLLTSIPVFCMGLFAPLAVPLQKKFGYRNAIVFFVFLIGIATLARIYFINYSGLLITSFVVGIGIANISPMMNAFIKEKFPTKFGSVIGVYSFAMGFGATISAGFTGIFYEQFHSNWALALGVWGILAFVAILCWLVAVGGNQTVEVGQNQTEEVRNPWKNKQAWAILLYFGLQTSLFFSLTTWLASIAMEQGMTLLIAGSVLTLMSVVQLVGNIFIPVVMNHYPNRIKWLASLIGIGFIAAFIFFIDTNWAIWTSAVLFGVVLSGLFPIGLMLPLDEAKNNQEANAWSSMVLSGGFMMGAIIPLVIGVIFDMTGNHLMTKVVIVLLFIALAISVLIMKSLKRVQYA
ncbi:MFS transporter [Solibacillus sp. FSL K6-1523]|uniref:MFS transporter n=1 Tax=Solibacillus sp. FSL K6-1523 TaxID=2921471 RepID=UPI0030F8CB8F